jgi:Cdc6-like AAA superfamily ATPase
VTPKPHAIIARERAKDEHAQAEIAQREARARAKEAATLMNITDFPVQINPYVLWSLYDRAVVIGMSGSGKTTWVKQLIPRVIGWWNVPILVLDSKGQNEFDNIATELHNDQLAPKILPDNGGILVWKPPLDDYAEYENWFNFILKGRKPCLVVIDELSSLGKGRADTYPPSYQLLLKQGRGLKMCVISMTQEVAYTPRQTAGQTSHVFRFHLINSYDVAASARILGINEAQRHMEPPLPFGFFYRRVDKPSPIYSFINWQQFFQVAA